MAFMSKTPLLGNSVISMHESFNFTELNVEKLVEGNTEITFFYLFCSFTSFIHFSFCIYAGF